MLCLIIDDLIGGKFAIAHKKKDAVAHILISSIRDADVTDVGLRSARQVSGYCLTRISKFARYT